MDTWSGHDKLLTFGAGLRLLSRKLPETLTPLLIDTGLELTKQLRTGGCEVRVRGK